jgi:hypothetical protein
VKKWTRGDKMREDSLFRVGIRMALKAAIDEAKAKKCSRKSGCCIDDPGYVTIKFEAVQDKYMRHAKWRRTDKYPAAQVHDMVRDVGLDPKVLFREKGFKYYCENNPNPGKLDPDIATAVLK